MSEHEDFVELSCGESIKLPSGSFVKYEARYHTLQKSDESVKDCFIRAKKAVDAMVTVMRPK